MDETQTEESLGANIPVFGSVRTAADYLARRNDRWMMMFLLIILLGFCGWVIEQQNDQLSSSRASSQKAQDQVVEFYRNANATLITQSRDTAAAMLQLRESIDALHTSVDRMDHERFHPNSN